MPPKQQANISPLAHFPDDVIRTVLAFTPRSLYFKFSLISKRWYSICAAALVSYPTLDWSYLPEESVAASLRMLKSCPQSTIDAIETVIFPQNRALWSTSPSKMSSKKALSLLERMLDSPPWISVVNLLTAKQSHRSPARHKKHIGIVLPPHCTEVDLTRLASTLAQSEPRLRFTLLSAPSLTINSYLCVSGFQQVLRSIEGRVDNLTVEFPLLDIHDTELALELFRQLSQTKTHVHRLKISYHGTVLSKAITALAQMNTLLALELSSLDDNDCVPQLHTLTRLTRLVVQSNSTSERTLTKYIDELLHLTNLISLTILRPEPAIQLPTLEQLVCLTNLTELKTLGFVETDFKWVARLPNLKCSFHMDQQERVGHTMRINHQ